METNAIPLSGLGASPTPRVPDHELLRRIGQGSYGEVWLARTLTATFRAVKVVSKLKFTDSRPFEREFAGIQKYEPISRTHPGLVSILHVGQGDDGIYFYYVMELADDLRDGQQINPSTYAPKMLSAILKGGALPLSETLAVALTLASTLAYLHDRGLVHRDLKPSNIIFVHGGAKFADIGLVTNINDKATFVGTEGYMPPEGPGKPGADIYALGKVLYEMASGRSCADFPELCSNLRDLENRAAWMQLNDIILHACAAKPDERLPSAQELHRRLLNLHQEHVLGAHNGSLTKESGSSPVLAGNCLLFAPGPEPDTSPVTGWLREHLRNAGCQVSTTDQPVLSIRWARELERQFQRADTVIFLLSGQTLNDDTTAYAAELAARYRRLRGAKLRLVLVTVGEVQALTPSFKIAFAEARVVSWRTAQDYEMVQAALLEA